MSNRRKLPNEKANRPRCRRCKSRDVLLKTGYGYVCQHLRSLAAPSSPARDEQGGA